MDKSDSITSQIDTIDDSSGCRYRGQKITVVRTSDEEFTDRYNYEFVLFINDTLVTTAGRIEPASWGRPWVKALVKYGKAYIDGADAQSEAYQDIALRGD